MLKKWPVLLLTLLVCLSLAAQKYTGTIRGTISDPSGAVVSGAVVTVTHRGTSAVRSATTGTEGSYAFPDLEAGVYDVSVKHPNFRETVSKGVEVHVSSEAVANIALQLGSVSEQVTVEANAVQVETATGSVGNVVEGNQVRELPLNGRSFVQLTQLMPGVSPQANFDSKNKGLMAGVDFSVNGNNTTGNLFLVDGVNNNDIGSNRTILVYPSVDAIQEFKVLRNSYGPEYGQAMGAIINIVTRGGTNSFHGGAFYFGRNDKLNAADYFNNKFGVITHPGNSDCIADRFSSGCDHRNILRRNDWGYNVGGPVVKDKLFFFWSQEWNHELRGAARFANVPTVAEKGGDFSTLRVASNGAPCENNPGFAAVPAGQTSTGGSLLVSMFPDPNIPASQVNPGDCNNWAQSLTAPIFWRQENVRIDYKLGKTWSIMGRYTHDAWSQPFPSTLGFWGDDLYPSIETSWLQPGYQATVKISKLFGSTAVNDFQVSYAGNRITAARGGTNPGLAEQIAAAIPTFYPLSDKTEGAELGYPIFWGSLGNGTTTSNALWTQAPWHNNEQLYVYKDDFSKVAGTHTFKVGFLGSANQKNEIVNPASGDAPSFWGAANQDLDPGPGTTNSPTTPNGVFNALWNQVYWGFGESQTNPFTQTRWHDYEVYFGDNWKALRNLTVEYGFRWSELRTPFSAVDKIANFQPSFYDPALGAVACNGIVLPPGSTACSDLGFAGGSNFSNRSLKENNNHAIAPRVGVAWDPRGDGKMSVRAGFGQFYQRERMNNYLLMGNNSPFSLSVGGNRLFDVAPTTLTANATPNFSVDTDSNLPNTMQWNLTVERELFRDTKLELAYVGNRGSHILRYSDVNAVPAAQRLNFALNNSNSVRPFGVGNWGNINEAQWAAQSNYHALQALFRSRIKGVDAQFAYTWSKSLADTDITNSGNAGNLSTLEDPFDPHANYGPTAINRKHTFVGNLVYNIPTLSGHGALVRGALGGWEIASILSYATGPSVTVFAGNNATGVPGGISGTGTGQTSTRPNAVAGQSCYNSGGAPDQWLNPNAWTLQGFAIGGFGDTGVGQCSGPGLANTDFSVYKNFKVTERLGIQFRIEMFNAFNKTQFRADSLSNQLSQGGARDASTNTLIWDRATNQTGNFGAVTNDRGPREIQYALKFTF